MRVARARTERGRGKLAILNLAIAIKGYLNVTLTRSPFGQNIRGCRGANGEQRLAFHAPKVRF